MPFAEDGLEVTEAETIKVDERMMTNLPGVFAAGDARPSTLTIPAMQSALAWSGGALISLR
jgi:thioredoxin reductase